MRVKPFYVFIFFLSFFLFTFNTGEHKGYFYSVDGRVEYEQMLKILKGNLSLLISPYKHLGLSLAEIPFYLIGEGLTRIFHFSFNPVFTLLINSFFSALLCLLVFLIVRILSSPKIALIITLIFGLSTTVWPYSKFDTADILLTLCVVAVFWALLNYSCTKRIKWFFLSLLFMAFSYVTKLTAHGFLLGWLFYIYAIDRENKVSLKETIGKFILVISVWCLFIPLSININKAHSQAYTWSWLNKIGYKFLVREFSPLDGLFWYCPLLFLIFFSAKDFFRKRKKEFLFFLFLLLPYFITIHLGKDIVCIYDFAGRYDLIYVPFISILLIPWIENFSKFSLLKRIIFFAVIIFAFYTQFLGASVSILYYANIIGPSLGSDWRHYVFSLRYSPFNVYPRLILQALTGLAMPIEGINNLSASILPPFKLDYFWARNETIIFKIFAFILLCMVISIGLILSSCAKLFDSLRKYYKEIGVIVVCFSIIWLILFVPKEIFLQKKEEIYIKNSGFEEFIEKGNKKIPWGWKLFDFSSKNGQPSLALLENRKEVIEGKGSLEIVTNQNYVTASLASQIFNVKKARIIQASCFIKSEDDIPYSIRIAFFKKNLPFYWAPTTKIEKETGGWKRLISQVVVPKGAQKAQILINIWGEVKEGESIFVDKVRIIGKQ